MPKYSPFNYTFSPLRRLVSWMCFLAGICFLMWSIFVSGAVTTSTERTLFVVDTSLSMAVRDISASGGVLLSRLDAVKQTIPSLFSQENALLTFSDVSTLDMPFSADRDTYRALLETLEPKLYGHATTVSHVFDAVETLYGGRFPLRVILFTDGENTSISTGGSMLPRLSSNIALSLVGVGTENGGPMLQGYDSDGKPRYKQYQGADAISRRDTNFLTKLSDTYHAPLFFIDEIRDGEQIVHDLPGAHPFRFSLVLLSGIVLLLLAPMISPYTYLRLGK